jgi:flagellar basal body-associated protein FliL
MQPETMSHDFQNQPIKTSKNSLNIKKLLVYVAVAIVAAGLSGILVWMYMSNQNSDNKKVLNAQITTKNSKIDTLQANVKTLNTQIAAKTTTTSTSGQPVASSGMYEALTKFCGTNNKTVQYVNMSNDLTDGTNGQYFGSCAVMDAGKLAGGYIITAQYTNNAWQELFEGQGLSEAQTATCTKLHIPKEIGTCS